MNDACFLYVFFFICVNIRTFLRKGRFARVNNQSDMTINTIKNLVSLKHSLLPIFRRTCKNNYVERRLYTSSLKFQQSREITRKVKSYGKLFIELPCNVQVKSIDPHKFPNMDTFLVNIHSDNTQCVDIEKLINIQTDESFSEITVKNCDTSNFSSDTVLVFQTPIQYDIDVKVYGDSDASISNILSQFISAVTERGNIEASKLQSNRMKFISSHGGSIVLTKSLQGDIEARTTNEGSITAEKCLGTNLQMRTENGNINLGSNYCEIANFSTINGELNLNNLHMEAIAEIKGEGCLHVSCLDGSLQANVKKGDSKINVVRLTGKSQIISEGLVDLIIPKENNIELNLKGNTLSLHESLRGSSVAKEQTFKTKDAGAF
ncbi:protein FAM185A-like isoform X2 [Venturia canescens]|uniref:protein FAM185A-like isoform X2 n=1 Tax=Venturia canescens TaxID=32260 RepID=UPI001C9CDC88|nr:protein FAM185A-like isoform X2 [Venturia canescens]